MRPQPSLLLAALVLASGCASPDIPPVTPLASAPVHYELRMGFAAEPAFDSGVPASEASPGGREFRVSYHVTFPEDRRAEQLLAGFETFPVAVALSPEEGQRLITGLELEEKAQADVHEGERVELSNLDEEDYLVGFDIDVAGGQKAMDSLSTKAAGGTKVELIARAAGAERVDLDVSFTWLCRQVGIASADLPPDRIAVALEPPVIVGHRARAQLTVPLGGVALLGGFRLKEMPLWHGSGWRLRSLGLTLVAFLTVESA